MSDTIKYMIDNGIDTFIEIGPGRTLSSFVKREKGERKVNILNISDVQTLEDTINLIKGA